MTTLARNIVPDSIRVDEYRRFIRLARSRGYSFETFENLEKCERCIVLRHDIDVDLHRALDIARVEAEEETFSSFFFMLHNPLYNVWSRSGRAVLREILALGHTVGLHFDPRFYEDDATIAPAIEFELDLLGTIAGTELRYVSFHQPLPGNLERDISSRRFESVYDAKYFHNVRYISDSAARWRNESIFELIDAGTAPKIQFLAHPVLWFGEAGDTLQARLQRAIEHRSARLPDELREAVNDGERGMMLYE